MQDAFGKALEATNKVLDTTIDLNSYQFEAAGRVTGTLSTGKGERSFADGARRRTKTGTAVDAPLNFWENSEFTQAVNVPTIEGTRRRRSSLSIRDWFNSR